MRRPRRKPAIPGPTTRRPAPACAAATPARSRSSHQLRDGARLTGPAPDTGERYDLVVVGGGLSGLAAAQFFLAKVGRDRAGPRPRQSRRLRRARQAQRVRGRRPQLLTLNGGTLNIEAPPATARVAALLAARRRSRTLRARRGEPRPLPALGLRSGDSSTRRRSASIGSCGARPRRGRGRVHAGVPRASDRRQASATSAAAGSRRSPTTCRGCRSAEKKERLAR